MKPSVYQILYQKRFRLLFWSYFNATFIYLLCFQVILISITMILRGLLIAQKLKRQTESKRRENSCSNLHIWQPCDHFWLEEWARKNVCGISTTSESFCLCITVKVTCYFILQSPHNLLDGKLKIWVWNLNCVGGSNAVSSHTTRLRLVVYFFVLTMFWRHLCGIRVQTHGKMNIYLLNINTPVK